MEYNSIQELCYAMWADLETGKSIHTLFFFSSGRTMASLNSAGKQPMVSDLLINNTIQYNIRLLEAVRMQRRTIIEREKYVENENVKMVLNE